MSIMLAKYQNLLSSHLISRCAKNMTVSEHLGKQIAGEAPALVSMARSEHVRSCESMRETSRGDAVTSIKAPAARSDT
jgi:putative component of membrane protein insertase Oxa1/YidC/SpoIIIJ protein YidD